MAQQNIGASRVAQRTAGSAINANFGELYNRSYNLEFTATANTTFVVPAGYMIEHIAYNNTTANAVTGGVKLGTTNGGTEVVTAQAVAANALDTVAGANVTKRIFSTTASTTVYLQAVTAWAAASVAFRVTIRKMY